MLENWSDAHELLLRAFPSAARGEHDDIRLTLHGQPLVAWRGVSSRHDSPDVVHLAAPVLSPEALPADEAAGRADDEASATASRTADSRAAGSDPVSAPASQDRTSNYELESRLLAQFGIDPDGPDIVELARAAEKLPLGGLRLLGGRPHVHTAVEFPIEDGWLASAAELVAAEAAALGKDNDEAAAGQERAIDVR